MSLFLCEGFGLSAQVYACLVSLSPVCPDHRMCSRRAVVWCCTSFSCVFKCFGQCLAWLSLQQIQHRNAPKRAPSPVQAYVSLCRARFHHGNLQQSTFAVQASLVAGRAALCLQALAIRFSILPILCGVLQACSLPHPQGGTLVQGQ